jgi:hypothetical protein
LLGSNEYLAMFLLQALSSAAISLATSFSLKLTHSPSGNMHVEEEGRDNTRITANFQLLWASGPQQKAPQARCNEANNCQTAKQKVTLNPR